MARKVRLYSPYKPVLLAEKLKAEMKRGWTEKEKKTGRVMGHGTESKMSLRFQRWRIRNDFATRFEVTMEPARGGTLIEGRMGTARSVGCFMVFWLGFVGFFLFMGLIILGSDDAPVMFKAVFLGIPTMMLFFGFFLLWLGRRKAPEAEEKILAFLAAEVKAREERG